MNRLLDEWAEAPQLVDQELLNTYRDEVWPTLPPKLQEMITNATRDELNRQIATLKLEDE